MFHNFILRLFAFLLNILIHFSELILSRHQMHNVVVVAACGKLIANGAQISLYIEDSVPPILSSCTWNTGPTISPEQ